MNSPGLRLKATLRAAYKQSLFAIHQVFALPILKARSWGVSFWSWFEPCFIGVWACFRLAFTRMDNATPQTVTWKCPEEPSRNHRNHFLKAELEPLELFLQDLQQIRNCTIPLCQNCTETQRAMTLPQRNSQNWQTVHKQRPTWNRKHVSSLRDLRTCLESRKRHIKLFRIKLLSVTPVTDTPGREPGQNCLYSLRSEDNTWNFAPWAPGRETPPSPEGSPAKNIYIWVPFSLLLAAVNFSGGAPKERRTCGETVVQKGAFGESVSSLPP